MDILVIGSGGREHAIAWKLARSPQASIIYVAPGNGGTQAEPKVKNLAVDPLDFKGLIAFAKEKAIALTIVGPEAPLAQGIVDVFTAEGLTILGPQRACAELESSKVFSKHFMTAHHIPTAKAATFSDLSDAKEYVSKKTMPIVIKADGLAAGKGVEICETLEDATDALESMLQNHTLGAAGNSVVIEQFLTGIELSYMVLTDGETIVPLASSQDHKARDEGDKGPNTGGMGAFSPSPYLTKALETKILETVIEPVIKGFKEKGLTYRGFLYAGLMIGSDGTFHTLEFNCRLGDPETQPILMRLKSDFAELCLHAAKGTLKACKAIVWDPRPALGVVLAAQGYPREYKKGELIKLPDTYADNEKIFHAGTRVKDSELQSFGGRVLCATALANNFKQAQEQAYELVDKIDWSGAYYRKDIGFKAVEFGKK